MKPNEIREFSVEELRQRVKDEHEQLRQLNFEHAIAELPNPMLLRSKRRFIARLETILRSKEMTQDS